MKNALWTWLVLATLWAAAPAEAQGGGDVADTVANAVADTGADTGADTDTVIDAVLSAPAEVHLGDKITVTLAVPVGAGDEVAVPEQSFAPFEMLDKTSGATVSPEGDRRYTFTLDLIGFEAGEHSLGPLDLHITTGRGELRRARSNAVEIRVVSLLANEPAPELKPAGEPVSVIQDDYTLAWILGALGAMLFGGLLTWLFLRWWRKRDRPEPAPPPPPPPWETALKELRAVERERMTRIGEGHLPRWVDDVSDVIRKYLGGRYGFDGLESTTDEAISRLRAAQLPGSTADDATAFLTECDLVKFAKAPMAESATETLLQNAYTLIDRTRGGVQRVQGSSDGQ